MKNVARVVLTIALLVSTAVAAGAAARDTDGSPNMITMNFQDVDISVLAKFISEITGKNFVLDESVRGKVSIISPTKVTPQQAYTIFQSVLHVKGFTTVQAGTIIKIVPSRMVRESAALTQSQQPGLSQGDEYVTRMIKLKNVEAVSLIGVIQPMISRDGLIAAYPETNTLILTDSAWNIQRLLQIIGSLDTQGIQQQIVVIPLKLAYADDLAPKIDQIMGDRSAASGGPQGGGFRPGQGVQAPSASSPGHSFKVVPDERTNSLVVLAGPVQMREIRELVDKLDIHSPNANSRIHVYYLKHAQAGEMMEVLSGLIGGGGGPTQLAPQTGRGALGRVGGMGMGGFGGGSFNGGGSSGFGGSFGGSSSMGSNSFGSSSFGGLSNSSYGGSGGGGMGGFGGGFGGGGGGGGGSSARSGGSISGGGASGSGNHMPTDFEMPVHITADPATNSLIISAAPQDYETLRTIISQLDIPRRQVFVQAVIAEVSANRSNEIGVNFQAATGFGNTLAFGQLNYGQLQNALTNPLGMSGLGIGLASNSLCNVPMAAIGAAASAISGTSTTSTTTASTVQVPCDIALLTALEQDTHSNVLSAPTLLTTDNNEATIVVGENLPFLSGASSSAALSNQIFSSVDRQNVGITLDIVPQITEGGYVKLDVYEEVSAVVPGTTNNTLGPTTTIRSASTSVLVQNHRTTVIGGLLSDETDTARSGVPYLSNIPVLGNLFSDRSHTGEKTNLLVFLTPHVIHDREDLRELSLDEREKFINRLGKKEMHDMPISQVRELYKPSFSIAVPPGAEMGAPVSNPNGPSDSDGTSRPSTFSPTPLNTEEIGPSTRLEGVTPGVSPAAPAPMAPARTFSAAPAAATTALVPASTGVTAASVDGSSKAVTGKDGGVLDAVSGLFGVRN